METFDGEDTGGGDGNITAGGVGDGAMATVVKFVAEKIDSNLVMLNWSMMRRLVGDLMMMKYWFEDLFVE